MLIAAQSVKFRDVSEGNEKRGGELINLGVPSGNFISKQPTRLGELDGKLLSYFGYKRCMGG